MRRPIALIATFLLTLSALAAAPRIAVPRTAKAPKIDGTLAANEWKGAVRVRLGDNAHALLLHDGKFLYVAMVGRQPGTSSVCAMGGKQVLVLHSSAALGTASFAPEKDKWRMTRGFIWTNRDTSGTPTAMAERKKTLDTDGWFANTSPTFTRDREYVMRIGNQREIPLTLGFLSFTGKEQRLYYWPEDVVDACADVELASGYTDREYVFEPKTWGVAELQ
jgi:hypothetical protein